jgi:Flp pilus assembly protein TadG
VRRLNRPRLAGGGARLGDDRGAIAALFVILLGSGLLLGLLALVVDVGRVYLERRVVQNSADAAVLGVAKECGLRAASCASEGAAQSLAAGLASANAPDGAMGIQQLCGRNPLTGCPAGSGGSNLCKDNSAYRSIVRLKTSTQTAGGATTITPFFADFVGAGSGASLTGCAQAAWGAAASASAEYPLLISACYVDFTSASVIPSWTTTSLPLNCDGTTRPAPVSSDGDATPLTGQIDGFAKARSSDYGAPAGCVIQAPLKPGQTIKVYAAGSPCADSSERVAFCDVMRPRGAFLVPVVRAPSVSGGSTNAVVSGFVYFDLLQYRDGAFSCSGGPALTCTTGTVCIAGTFSRYFVPGARIDTSAPNLGVIAVEQMP